MKSNLAFQEEAWEEMMDGRSVAMSPRPSPNHNRVAFNIARIFANYLEGRTCEAIADGTDLYLDERNRFIPDMMVVCDPAQIGGDGVHGAPALVAEVLSPSTAKNDRGHKKDAYEKSGVREYWLVEPNSKTVEQYLLQDGRFVLQEVYAVYPDVMLAKMSQEERECVKRTFRCSLYEDLNINLEDIFRRVR